MSTFAKSRPVELVFIVKTERATLRKFFSLEQTSDLAQVTRVGLMSYIQSLLFGAHDLLEGGVVQHRILSSLAIWRANEFRCSLRGCDHSGTT